MGVPSDLSWQSCNYTVNAAFRDDWMKNYQTQLPDMLQDGVRALIYAGDQDYICNWLGNQAWTLAMEWTGKDAFNAASNDPYRTADGVEVGQLRSAKGLSFLRIYSAGHMVPLDQPEVALYMLNEFFVSA